MAETGSQKAARVSAEHAAEIAQLRADGHRNVSVDAGVDPGFVVLTAIDAAGKTFSVGDFDGDVPRMIRQLRSAVRRFGQTPSRAGG